MKYKLVAMDCDGTFLDSQGNISPKNAYAVKQLKAMGIEVLLATGRSDVLTRDYVEELGINLPVIACNGASLSDVITGERMYIHPIAKPIAQEVIKACIKENIPCKAFSIDACYTSDTQMLNKGMKQVLTMYTRELKYTINYKWLNNEDMLKLTETEDFVKIVTVNEDIDKLLELQSYLCQIPGLQVLRSNINCLDMIADNVSKGQAMLEYAESKNITAEECIAFGDNENDISMLQAAGLGIAMGNADDTVKQAADRVAPTNDECGVAEELIKIFNLPYPNEVQLDA
jgi:hypothetical protein